MRAIRKLSLTLSVVAILLLLAIALTSVGANSRFTQPSAPKLSARAAVAQTMKTYTMYSGLWRTDGSFVSTIRIKNVLVVAPLDVTPVLFMADGTPYMLSSVHVPVSGVATVSVNDALASAPQSISSHVSQFGSVSLIWTYSSPGHVSAQVAAIDASRSLSYTYSFMEPMAMPGHNSKQVLEGLWWKRDSGVTGSVTLSNTTDHQQAATLTPVHPGKSADPQQVVLAPHSTQMLTLEALGANASSPDNRAGGIRVEYEGSMGAILVNGGLVNENEGYSANMPFWSHDMSSAPSTSITYASAGLMIGKPDPMMMPGFPKDTTFSPYVALRNTTQKPLDVALQVNYMMGMGMEGSMPVTKNLPTQHLAPFEAKQLDLEGPLAAAGLKSFNGSINLSVSFTGKAGDLVLATGSVDQTGTYVFEVEAQAVGVTRGMYTGYWSVTNGNDSMFTLWNPTSKTQDLTVTLYYGDGSGQYDLPVHLDPQASVTIDVAMLIAKRMPDNNGNVIPSNVQDGSAFIASAAEGGNTTIVLAGGVFNVSSATCGVICVYCDGYGNTIAISPNPINVAAGASVQCSASATDARGNPVSLSGGTWSVANGSVATVDQSGNVTGAAPGSTTVSVVFHDVIAIQGNYCTSTGASCPPSDDGSPATPVNVMPTITGPNTVWYFSNLDVSGYTTSAQLTANGGDSSTTWNITAGANNITVSSFTGSSISVLSSGTAFSSSVGDTKLTATANGQTSAPFSLTTRTPNRLVPGLIQTSCDNTFGYVTDLHYAIRDQLEAALPADVPMNEHFPTGVVNDYPGTNWQRGPEVGLVISGSAFFDQIQGQDKSVAIPLPTCDGNSTPVHHFGQEWRVGSEATGFGRRVQTDTLQRYIGHAAHLSIVSPAP